MIRLQLIFFVFMLSFNALAEKSSHGEKFNIKCDVCHNPEGWTFKTKNNTFDHAQTQFKLTGQHQSITCRKCHPDLKFSTASTTCISCHKDIHQQTVGQECDRCHTPVSWVVKNITEIHRQSRFPLNGMHSQTDCYQCHKSASLLRFDPVGIGCADCHSANYAATTNPSHVASKFPKDCFLCHNEKSWQPAKFDHNISTGFPLTGSHIGIDCAGCHAKGYAGAATDCAGCHLTNYNATTKPGHVAAKFSTDCKICHSSTAWTPATFNHTTGTTFPLTGAHVGVACIDCHSKGYTGISTDCVSCHLTNYNATTKPGHVAAKFSTDCKLCHSSTAWTPATFNHTTGTTFPLTGAHVGVACIDCHSKGYTGISTDCVSCHLTNFNATTKPGHVAAKFSTDCKICHASTAWTPATFNHTTGTSFPLTGAHIGVACIDCHSKGYTGISTDCVSCHLTNFNATTKPGHVAAKFSTDCKICHSSTAWTPATFNHTTGTTFPLTGAHVGIACISCHSAGYAGISTDCVSCHLTNYNATTKPGHVAAKFSTDCKLCHSSTAWTPATFNHTTGTTFPLTGAHVGVACISCHSAGYAGISTDCVSCHLTNYNATTKPGHVAAKFSTDCKLCHSSTAWTPATFNHTAGTTFPLTGAHVGVACISCHSAGYAGISTACVSCHQNDYNATTNPGHVAAKFSTDCKICHSATAWTPATFNHTTGTSFPLTGAHVGVACINCHSKGYVGISTDCVSCHLNKYTASTNPAHTAAKFPTTCATCHSTTAWVPSTYNHDSQYFPINSGRHKGQWTLCSECHTNATNFAVFNCLLCHAHSNKASVDSDHRGRSGYVYNSTNCYSCHPRGNS